MATWSSPSHRYQNRKQDLASPPPPERGLNAHTLNFVRPFPCELGAKAAQRKAQSVARYGIVITTSGQHSTVYICKYEYMYQDYKPIRFSCKSEGKTSFGDLDIDKKILLP